MLESKGANINKAIQIWAICSIMRSIPYSPHTLGENAISTNSAIMKVKNDKTISKVLLAFGSAFQSIGGNFRCLLGDYFSLFLAFSLTLRWFLASFGIYLA
jgi:hypothetical protein